MYIITGIQAASYLAHLTVCQALLLSRVCLEEDEE
jgi:hypothetical protein